MFSFGYLLMIASAIVAATALMGTANIQLPDVGNSTMCAMEIKRNEDPNRIPERILEIKCAKETDKWCKHYGLKKQECCQHKGKQLATECAEISLVVWVVYKDTNVTVPLEVAVGCTCLISRITVAPPAPGPWDN